MGLGSATSPMEAVSLEKSSLALMFFGITQDLNSGPPLEPHPRPFLLYLLF
jgi:hypothetical protein